MYLKTALICRLLGFVAVIAVLYMPAPVTSAPLNISKFLAAEKAGDQEGIVRAATEIIEKKRVDKADRAMAYDQRAQAHRKLGRNKLGLADYQSALKLFPRNKRALVNAGIVAQELKQYRVALGYFESVTKWHPKYPHGHFYAAIFLVELKKYPEALLSINNVLKIAPNSHSATTLKGNIFLEMEKYDEAVEQFNKVILTSPDNAVYRISRGKSYRGVKQNDLALRDFEHAVKVGVEPQIKFAAWLEISKVQRSNKSFDAAHITIGKIIKLVGSHPLVLVARGQLYKDEGKPEAALQDFNAAHLTQLRLYAVYALRSEVHLALGRNIEALADANVVTKHAGVLGVSARAKAYEALGRVDDAIRDYEKILAASPNAEWARERLKILRAQR
jgi:tetratricopeptide (TPR) repeat protein